MIFALTQTALRGVPSGLISIAGLVLGFFIWLLITLLGVTALLLAYPQALEFVRLFGAAYLLFLAVQIWRSDALQFDPSDNKEKTSPLNLQRDFRHGVVVNLFNPKIGVFCLTFLPQFVRESVGPVWGQILFLGILTALIGVIPQVILVLAIGKARKSFLQEQTAQNMIMKSAAVIMVSLALWIFWEWLGSL